MLNLPSELNQIAISALRSGMPIEAVIANLEYQAELLRASLPIVKAITEKNPC
jgi:hypothetical protein